METRGRPKLTIAKFNKEFGSQGGFQKLLEMKTLGWKQKEMAKYFGVHPDKIRRLMKALFDENGNPKIPEYAE